MRARAAEPPACRARQAGLALALPLLAVLLPVGAAQAQELRFLVGNTGTAAAEGTSTGDIDVGHSVAQGFRTGGNAAGYFLTTVGLPLGVVSGGSTAVTLRESAPSGTLIHTFTSPTLAANGTNRFDAKATTHTGAVLKRNTNYFIVLRETAGEVHLKWLADNVEDTGGASGFSIKNDRRWCSSPCSSWNSVTSSVIQINITGRVNFAPTSENKTITAYQNAPYTFSSRDFPFSDTGSGAARPTVKIESLPGRASWR